MHQRKNQVSAESKNTAIKTLAILGFITVIVVGLWAAVQFIRFIPSAVSTLASITSSVYREDIRLVVATDKNIVNSEEAFTVSWTNLEKEGVYSFSYQCVDGVSAEIRDTEGDSMTIDCESDFQLSPDRQSMDVILSSEHRRFVDVPFTISFLPEKESAASAEKTSLVTVVNASIAKSSEVGIRGGTDEPNGEIPGGSGNAASVIESQTNPIITSTVPISDPNGITDLKITYLGIGIFDKDTNAFDLSAALDTNKDGAVRFKVENIGTKTSGTWGFTAKLPTSPLFTYESPTQAALKPSESEIFTLGFDDVADAGSNKLSVELSGGTDVTIGNNSFDWTVTITD